MLPPLRRQARVATRMVKHRGPGEDMLRGTRSLTVCRHLICSRTSAELKSRRAHLLAEHLAPYSCCGKRFGAASKFNKHLKENHDYTDTQISSLREMGSNLSLEMACLVRGLGTCKSKGDFRSRLYKEGRKVYDLRDEPPTDRKCPSGPGRAGMAPPRYGVSGC